MNRWIQLVFHKSTHFICGKFVLPLFFSVKYIYTEQKSAHGDNCLWSLPPLNILLQVEFPKNPSGSHDNKLIGKKVFWPVGH